MNQVTAIDQAVELIRLRVKPENRQSFLAGRTLVDEFTGSLPGYISTELLQLNDTDWLMQIRWADTESVVAAQKITANAPVISDWLSRTSEFVSFDTAFVRYSNPTQGVI